VTLYRWEAKERLFVVVGEHFDNSCGLNSAFFVGVTIRWRDWPI